MGARARTYFSNGTLCDKSVTYYNTTSTNFMQVSYRNGCGGYVYSQGFTEAWNGNGYDRTQAPRTPNILF